MLRINSLLQLEHVWDRPSYTAPPDELPVITEDSEPDSISIKREEITTTTTGKN